MNLRQAIAGMLQLFAVFLLFGAGFFFTCLPFNLMLRIQLSDFLRDRPDLCTLTGVAFFALALLFTLGFYATTRGRYQLLNVGGNLVRIDSRILQRTIAPLLHKQFSSAIRLSDVEIIKGRHLELRVFMDPLEPKEHKKLLLDAEQHLTKLLSERFGYHRPFTLQVLQV